MCPARRPAPFLSPATRSAQALVTQWMEAAGLEVTIDAVGNLHASAPSLNTQTPRLLIGSHLDTVVNAGAFDGPLGILLGLALVELAGPANLPFAIELIAFSEEEGIRFRQPFLGSLAVIGESVPLTVTDSDGITLARAIANHGHTPTAPLLLDPKVFGYLEFHIEQGPVLEAESRPLAAVHAIAGQTRLRMVFRGQANHAGTTPMHLRRDALAAASAWIVAVETLGRATPGLVATVGSISAEPGISNVIPGEVVVSLDVRHALDHVRRAAVASLTKGGLSAAADRGLTCTVEPVLDQPAVPMDARLTDLLVAAAASLGHDAAPMVSGAGHDAMILARRVPACMLFVRTPGGLSHHPDESVLPEDVAAALATGLVFVQKLTPLPSKDPACTT